MDVAALHHGAQAAADQDGAVPVDGPTFFQVELAVEVEALRAEPSPPGDVAVLDADLLAPLESDHVLQPAAEGQAVEDDVLHLVQFEQRPGAVVAQHEAWLGGVANPPLGGARLLDQEMPVEGGAVEHDGLGDGDLAGPGAEGGLGKDSIAIGHAQLVGRVLGQVHDAAPVHGVLLDVGRRQGGSQVPPTGR